MSEAVLRYIERRGGKSSEGKPLADLSIIEQNGSDPNPYIAQIYAVGGRYGLERNFLNSSVVQASEVDDNSVFEVRTGSKGGQIRHYYVVRDGQFELFAIQTFGNVTFEEERQEYSGPSDQSSSKEQETEVYTNQSRFRIPEIKPVLFEMVCNNCGSSLYAVSDTDLLPKNERPHGYTITELECIFCRKKVSTGDFALRYDESVRKILGWRELSGEDLLFSTGGRTWEDIRRSKMTRTYTIQGEIEASRRRYE